MTKFSFTKQQAGHFDVSGDLTRDSLGKVSINHFRHLFEQSDLSINLSELEQFDTAGLAWLLLLIEHGKKQKVQVSFTNLSTELLNLAKLSGVDALLTSRA